MTLLTRRQFLQETLATGLAGTRLAGLAGAYGTGAAGLAGCAMEPGGSGSAATFEVTDTGALLSLFSPDAAEATVLLWRAGEDMDRVEPIGPVEFLPERGNTAVVELENLLPDTDYFYAVDLGGELGPAYRLRTAPRPDADAGARFVVSADIDVEPMWRSPIFASMATSGADFFVCLGDWPYADNAPGAWTADEYRERHVAARADVRVQTLLRAMPAYAMYDDHEARNDWDARFRDTEAERIAAALTVWDEFFPLRSGPGRYRSWTWGRHLELFLLDTRLYRSRNDAPDGPEKTMLGKEQLDWLVAGVFASTASFKIIFTTVPLDFGLGPDHWASFARERDALLQAVSAVPGVLFLSADQHWFAAHRHGAGAREFQVGPLARGIPEPPPLRPEIMARAAEYNYGEVVVTGGAAPVLTFVARDQDGGALYEERFTPYDLRANGGLGG